MVVRLRLLATLTAFLLYHSTTLAHETWLTIDFSSKAQDKWMVIWMRQYFAAFFKDSEEEISLGENEDFAEVEARLVQRESLQLAPYSSIGKVFYFDSANPKQARSCTGFFVSESAVMTAAHCVMGLDGQWRQGLVFLTNFGNRQVVLHSADCVAVHPNWGSRRGDQVLEFDYALIRVGRPSSGGYLQLTLAHEPEAKFRVLGYGTDWPTTMIELSYDGTNSDPSGNFFAIDRNPMGAGSSGSPWLNESDKVFSLSSHYFDHGLGHKHGDLTVHHDHGHMHGPSFNDDTLEMLDFVSSGCGLTMSTSEVGSKD